MALHSAIEKAKNNSNRTSTRTVHEGMKKGFVYWYAPYPQTHKVNTQAQTYYNMGKRKKSSTKVITIHLPL